MKKQFFLPVGLFFFLSFSPLFAQRNLSVDLDDPVYRLLNSLRVRNLCSSLPTAKPYSHAVIVKALQQALQHPDSLYPMEADILHHYIDELTLSIPYAWYQTGSYREDSLKKQKKPPAPVDPSLPPVSGDDAPHATDEPPAPLSVDAISHAAPPGDAPAGSEPLPGPSASPSSAPSSSPAPIRTFTEVGIKWKTHFSADAFSGGIGTDNYVTGYILGDISDFFSYRIQGSGGIGQYSETAYEPFRFKKSWAGPAYPFTDNIGFNPSTLPTSPSGMFNLNPEFDFAFLDDAIQFRFGRINKDWGYKMGDIMLSYDAIPFASIDATIHPVPWFAVSQTLGWLEPEWSSGASDYSKAENFQNMFSATKLEFFADPYFYIAAFSTAVFLKRPEGAYAIPGLPPQTAQFFIGDYDNVQLGASIAVKYPGYADLFYSCFTDETYPMTTTESFFHKDRNMWANQVGFNLEIPQIPFTAFTFTYTKIEPYMHTHPLIGETPYSKGGRSTTYLNAGQNLGYSLEPNSDEFLFLLNTQPFWFFNAKLKYSMVRHGADVDGSSLLGKPLDYSKDLLKTPLYNKNFLKDGVYEWFHTLGIEGEVDLKFIRPAIPIKLSLGYYFIYRYHTRWEGGSVPPGEINGGKETHSKIVGGSLHRFEDAVFKDRQQHLFSIGFHLF